MNADHNSTQRKLFLKSYAEIIPIVFNLRNDGYSLPEIANELNSRGFLTRENKPFSHVQVLRILQRAGCADPSKTGAQESVQNAALESQVHCEVEQLKSEIYTLKTQVEELQQELSDLKSQVEELQNKSLLQKSSYVEIPVDSQIDPAEPVAAFSEEKPIEPAPTPLSRKPARPASEIKKVVLQQANKLHVENSDLTKSHIAKVLSEIFDIRFETVRDWLKKLW